MKFKLFSLLTAVAIISAMLGVTPVHAAAYGTAFVTSITYQNVGAGDALVSIDFYPQGNGTPINLSLPSLAKGAGTSLYVGSVANVSAGFMGSAVLSSSEPLVATLVQVPSSATTVKNRPLSNGFSGGAAYVLVPTILKGTFGYHSVFSIQNTDVDGADLTVKFVPSGGGTTITDTITNLPSGAAKYYDMGKDTLLPATFNGSVQVTAKKTGTQTPGAVIATSMEMQIAGNNVYAFEGASTSANTIYMPTAFCNWGNPIINSSYAVQNVDTAATASVTVVYSNGNSDGPYNVLPGEKKSFPGCGVSGTTNPAGFIGSAKIQSTGGQIVAVGKVFGGGLSTAFLGFSAGAEKIALPYVRWTDSQWFSGARQRTNIAIQNVGTASLAIGAVQVKFFDKDGNQVGATVSNTAALAVGGKFSVSPRDAGAVAAEFGYTGTAIGGGAIVQGPAGSALAVIARVQTYNPAIATSVGEDYSGIPIQ